MTTGAEPVLQVPSFADIQAAAIRLTGHAVVTPLLESPLLNDRLGGRLLVKAEPLQRTGSFKYRGAFNRICLIPASERARGVVAFSSGNHAQGVAAAARDLGLSATIIMPADAPTIKLRNTRSWGARIVTYDRLTEDREAIGAAVAAETGASLIKPFDDAGVIAGQGTVGLELASQAAAAGVTLDAVLVPVSGGGLLAGTALALSVLTPQCPVYGVEPAGFDDAARSLAQGHRIAHDGRAGSSFCDALLSPMVGAIPFELIRRAVTGGFAVTDDEVADAIAIAFDYFKLVVEPGGAVALAAVLSGRLKGRDRTLAVVCSGGNVDPALFAAALTRSVRPQSST